MLFALCPLPRDRKRKKKKNKPKEKRPRPPPRKERTTLRRSCKNCNSPLSPRSLIRSRACLYATLRAKSSTGITRARPSEKRAKRAKRAQEGRQSRSKKIGRYASWRRERERIINPSRGAVYLVITSFPISFSSSRFPPRSRRRRAHPLRSVRPNRVAVSKHRTDARGAIRAFPHARARAYASVHRLSSCGKSNDSREIYGIPRTGEKYQRCYRKRKPRGFPAGRTNPPR